MKKKTDPFISFLNREIKQRTLIIKDKEMSHKYIDQEKAFVFALKVALRQYISDKAHGLLE